MLNSDILERYGNLLKAEQLVTMEDKIMPNTFVLEAPEPFRVFFIITVNLPVIQSLYTFIL